MSSNRRFVRSNGGRQSQSPLQQNLTNPSGDNSTNNYSNSSLNSNSGSNEANHNYAPLPKHIPFPESSTYHTELINEAIIFAFTVIAAATQFLHLYRTVWWLPNSYTNETMNFYLVDKYLAIFIVTMLGRRIVYTIITNLLSLTSVKEQAFRERIIKFIYFGLLLNVLGFCSYQIFQKHSSMYIFCLCYPLFVYMIIFGFKIDPFLKTTYETDATYLNGIPLHCCSTNPNTVRVEVKALKTDFNNRFKQVIYTSVINAYYAGFIPCCFAQKYLYYDIYWATQHLGFIWLGGFTMCAVYCFPAKYCDVLHRAALHLGQWNRVENKSHSVPAISWSKTIVWPPGSLVKHCGDFYRAVGPITAAIPANSSHYRFNIIFRNPSFLYFILAGIQMVLVLLQLIILFYSLEWHNTISISYLILTNYHTLFRLMRNYLVGQKIYTAESSIYTKLNAGIIND